MHNRTTLCYRIICMLICLPACAAWAQAPPDTSYRRLNEVVVSGIKDEIQRQTPLNITVITPSQINRDVNYSVADALAKIPGISQLSTGIGISKPVIRGLFGNRIQTVVMGIRFDNQQWQDEHGLGLSAMGIGKLEVVKGPSSLLYGTEAMGGVINIVEEFPAPVGKTVGDFSTGFYSNTLGNSTQIGFRGNNGKKFWRIRAGVDTHADYSDGNNNRVLNSRFNSYNIKASLGFIKKNLVNVNHIYISYSQFGFINADNQNKKPVDGRFSRAMDGPNHSVFFAIISTENTITLKKSRLRINGGFHNNIRLENEGGNKISLNMQLNTITYNLRWYKDIAKHLELVIGSESQFQTNRNYGSRVIIPNANMFQTTALAYLNYELDKVSVEVGASFAMNNIYTYHTANMDYTNGEIRPLDRWMPSGNGNVGISWNPISSLNIKLNVSSGYRAPNLAELSSNGLHEGTFRWEIGNINMKIEQNINSELGINFETKEFRIYAAAFYNHFFNYIYLSPTAEQYIGFQVYRFIQEDARLYGGEVMMYVYPIRFAGLYSTFSTVTGQTTNGNYLPFIPANKWTNGLEFKGNISKKLTGNYVKAEVEYYFEQNHPGQFETSTPAYFLLNAFIGTTVNIRNYPLSLSLSARNLLNTVYYDHLSRFKYFNIYNSGVNICLNISMPFEIPRK